MQTIELYTADGGFVTRVEMPPFNPPPLVIIWGLRFFVLNKEVGEYREAFTYFVPLQEF